MVYKKAGAENAVGLRSVSTIERRTSVGSVAVPASVYTMSSEVIAKIVVEKASVVMVYVEADVKTVMGPRSALMSS